MRQQFTEASPTPAPMAFGHRGQGVVYMFQEEMTQKAEAIKLALDEGMAQTANKKGHIMCIQTPRTRGTQDEHLDHVHASKCDPWGPMAPRTVFKCMRQISRF